MLIAAANVDTPTMLKEFLNANGLSFMQEGPPSTDEVKLEATNKTDQYREKRDLDILAREEAKGQRWEKIKKTTLLLNGVIIPNPYPGRIYYPKPDSNEWIREFRLECKQSLILSCQL